jgi:hypothetical protein
MTYLASSLSIEDLYPVLLLSLFNYGFLSLFYAGPGSYIADLWSLCPTGDLQQ